MLVCIFFYSHSFAFMYPSDSDEEFSSLIFSESSTMAASSECSNTRLNKLRRLKHETLSNSDNTKRNRDKRAYRRRSDVVHRSKSKSERSPVLDYVFVFIIINISLEFYHLFYFHFCVQYLVFLGFFMEFHFIQIEGKNMC